MNIKLFFLGLILILNTALLIAQEAEQPFRIIPMTPEAKAITQFGDIEVNLAKGIPNIEIPIYTLKIDDMEIPISISYDASGVKVNDISSAVGLKWSLNTGGMIARNIIGKCDYSTADGYFGLGDGILSSCEQGALEHAYENYDFSPDEYYYNFLGFSGSFMFDRDKDILFGHDNNLVLTAPWDQSCDGFIIVDDKGNIYEFDHETTTSITSYYSSSLFSDRSGSGTTGWFLTKIITPRGDEVTYHYSGSQILYDYTDSYKMTLKTRGVNTNTTVTDVDHYFQIGNTRIDSIITPTAKIFFGYEEDNNLAIIDEKLDNIEVVETFSNNVVRNVSFHHSTFSGDARLKLTKVEFTDPENDDLVDNLYEYTFEYNDSYSLPTLGSYKRDVFGYYNSNTQYHMMPNLSNSGTQYTEADRSVDETKVLYGILDKVIYPTGGYSEFTYEANKQIETGDDKYAPGARVKSIKNKSTDGVLLTQSDYEYSGLSGTEIWIEDDYSEYKYQNFAAGATMYYTITNYSSNKSFSPSFNGPFTRYNGWFYQYVKVKKVGDQQDHMTQHRFASYRSIFSYLPRVVEITDYASDGTTKVKQNSLTYTTETTASHDMYYMGETYLFYGYYYCGDDSYYSTDLPDLSHLEKFFEPIETISLDLDRPSLDKETIKYYDNGSLSLEQISDHTYNDNYLTSTITTTYSSTSANNRDSKTTFVYPDEIIDGVDFTNRTSSNEITAIRNMVEGNMINYPIETYTAVEDDVIQSSYKKYIDESGLINLKQLQALETDTSLVVSSSSGSTTFTPAHLSWNSNNALLSIDNHYSETNGTDIEYSSEGKIIELTKGTDHTVSYIWGYDMEYPIAQVANASEHDVFHTDFEEEIAIDGWPGNTSLSNVQKQSGRYSLKSVNTNYATSEIFHGLPRLEIDNAQTVTYKLSGWVYSEGPSVEIHSLFYDSNGTYLTGDNVSTSETHKWVFLEKEIDVPSNVKEIMPRLDNNKWTAGTTDGIVYYDNVRFHPSVAQMVTFTYEPEIGISSQSDANNVSIHYDYDDFGRLTSVKDSDGNLVKQVEYNYVNQ